MRKITIIGSGNVGTTLGVLFARKGYEIADVLNRSVESAERACGIIGAGKATDSLDQLSPADIFLVTTGDNALHAIGKTLAGSPAIKKGAVVFHCSGATPSSVFSPLREKGAMIASVHPVKTFTSPLKDADTFPGTWCGVEGDAGALTVLEPMFQEIGGRIFPINGENKVIYHSAIVFICNYLFSLIEVGLQCYEKAGVPRPIATKVVEPILHATVDNALRAGPGKAITGPIARGDDLVVDNQIRALGSFKPEFRDLYKMLGKIAVDLSVEKGVAPADKIEAIRRLVS